MILQNCNVELTKVHYYDINHSGRNLQISTISRNDSPTTFKKKYKQNTVIKKNIFGHRWVLRINESNENLKKSKIKLTLYVLVFICIIVAVGFGIFLSIESKYFRTDATSKPKSKQVPTLNNNSNILVISQKDKLNLSLLYNTSSTGAGPSSNQKGVRETIRTHNETINDDEISKNVSSTNPCSKCYRNEEICLNLIEYENPKCKKIIDKKDPTGCGGLCKVNTEICKLLDGEIMLFQCKGLQNKLNCTSEFFNCGNRCIPRKLRCDGMFHCSDQSDERDCDCNLNTNFQCGNATSCLDRSKKCDGRVDCWDNSDEINCNRVCAKGEVPCHNGQCINKEKFCDGIYQCPDKSDEPIGCEIQK